MLPPRNTWRTRITLFTLALMFSGGPVSQARAQPIAPADSIALFESVRGWVEHGEVPGVLPETEPHNAMMFGASVVIRLDGRIVGRGVSIGPGARAGHHLDAAAEALRVASGAIEEAGSTARIAVSLELADRLIPMSFTKDDELAMRVSPGLDGLAMRRGTQTTAWFPSQMLERNALPSAVLGPLVTLLGGPAMDKVQPAFELQERGYTMYRFRTTHLASPLPGLGPVFLHRGGRVVRMSQVTQAGLREMAEGLVGHLLGLEWRGPEQFGLGGAINPVTGRRTEIFASPIVQGTAAMALLRASGLTGMDPATAQRARASGEQLLRELSTIEESEAEPWAQPGSAAACVVALAELDPDRIEADESLRSLRDLCLASVRESFETQTGFVGVGAAQSSLVALAMVRDAAMFGGDQQKAIDAINSVYRDTPPGMLVAQMPWLGWASLGLADLADGSVGAATRLRAMRMLVWDNRLRSVDLEYEDRDLAGGVVFTRGTTPLPTWQSARPVAFFASMLGREELTPGQTGEGEWPGELVRVLESIRFFMQLSAGLEESHMYPHPGLARWGVRASLWDQSMPTEASVLVLLTVCETLDSLEIRARAEP